MTVTLTSVATPSGYSAHTFTSVATVTGGDSWSIKSTANGVPTSTVIAYLDVPAAAGLPATVQVALTGASAAPTRYKVLIAWLGATETWLSSASADATVGGSEVTIPVTIGAAPAGTTRLRIHINLYADPYPYRTLTVNSTTATIQTSAAAELLTASLERSTGRSAHDSGIDSIPIIIAAPVGALAGQLTYLCNTAVAAAALDALYCWPGKVTSSALDYVHRAVGKVRLSTEKALPGRPAKWLVQVEAAAA